MQIEIDFQPDDGPMQTLYADWPQESFKRIDKILRDPKNADQVVTLSCRVRKDGPTSDWMFRVGRVKLRKVGR